MTSFADIESDLASGVISTFANAVMVAGAASVSVVFTDSYQEVLGMAGASKIVDCNTADVVGVAHGDAVTVGGVSYTVKEVQADGHGITRMLLR